MTKKHPAFDLIKALDLNEKRYFKLYSSLQKRNSNILQLFNFHAKKKTYNEELIRKHFAGEKMLDQLAVTNNHLHDAILRAMRAYHIKWSIDAQLLGLLQDLQFLFEKRLTDQAKLVLRKLKRLALAYDKHKVMLEVLEWESRILASDFFVSKDEADIDRISDEYYERLGLLQNEREYQDLQMKLFNNYYKVGIERKNENYKTNDQIINQFALKQSDRALTFKSRACYLNIHAQYNKVNNNWEEAYKYRKELKEHLSTKPKMEQVDYKNILASINNLIPICIKLEKYGEVEGLILELNKLPKLKGVKSTKEIELRILIQGAIAELALCVIMGRKDEGLKVIDKVIDNLDDILLKARKFPQLHLYFNISYFYTSIGEYSLALRWLNRILNDTGIKYIEDLHASTRLLTMILQFELGRSELLEYLARSANRYLKKLEGIYEFETLMLKFMKKHSRIYFDGEQKEELAILKQNLEAVKYEPGERNALSTLDLPAWVQSKIEGRYVYKIMRDRRSDSN